MEHRTDYRTRFLYGVLTCLIAIVCASCSDDISEGTASGKDKTRSVTFHLSGLDGQLQTRATSGTTKVDFDKYEVKLYLFGEEKGSSATTPENPYPGFKFITVESVNSNMVTIKDLDSAWDYIYVCVAYEKVYAEEAKVKVWDAENFSVSELTEESLYYNCFISALNETENYTLESYKKKEDAEDDFMIFGAGGAIPTLLDSFTPIEIALTRQMGAVVFSTGSDVESIPATCSVWTEYYRIYLSQMVETINGTKNHCDDYNGMNVGSPVTKKFNTGTTIGSTGLKGYVMYLPCTTTKALGDDIGDEKANVDKEGIGKIETSITINGKKYSTTTPFPIYPNRRTILTIGDGSKLTVSFGDENGIDKEDEWNGGL